MADFNQAVQILLKQEGGFSDDPNDPGGATNYGISLRFLRAEGLLNNMDFDHDGDVDADDMRLLPRDVTVNIYLTRWWEKYGYGSILNQDVANKLLSFSVNMGAHQAHKLIQRALRATGRSVQDDGILGPNTLSAITGADSLLLAPFRSEAAGFYRLVAALHPAQAGELSGWLNRAYS